MQFGRILLSTALLALTLNSGGPAYAQKGKDTIDKLVQTFTSWNGKPSDRSAYSEAAKLIDYRGMAERSLSPVEWHKLNAVQKNQFTGTLQTLIEDRYYTRWHRIFGKGKLTYQGESSSGSDLVVKTQLSTGKKAEPLDWRLDTVGGEHKVISLAVEDTDLLKKLSSRLQGRLSKQGFDGLLVWMKNKASLGPGDTTSPGTASASK